MITKALLSLSTLLVLASPALAEKTLGTLETGSPTSTATLQVDSVTSEGHSKTYTGLHMKVTVKEGTSSDAYEGVPFAVMGLTGGSKEQQNAAEDVTNAFCKQIAKMGRATDYAGNFTDELSTMEAAPGHDWLVVRNTSGNLEAHLETGKHLMASISRPAYDRLMKISQITCGK